MSLRWHFLRPLYIYIASVRRCRTTPNGSYIIAANHESAFDAVVLMLAFRRAIRFVAAGHLRSPRERLWLYNVLAVFGIGRSIPTGNGSLERCRRVVQQDGTIGIFPEGDIHPKYRQNRIHTGTIVLAHQLQVPVVPVKIEGTGALWPISRWPKPWRLHSLRVVIGAPIAPVPEEQNLTREGYQMLSDQLMITIKNLC